jgi:gamma-glutamylcyclotransferase
VALQSNTSLYLLNYLKGNSMTHHVFAFGSNMCSGRFRAYGVHPEGAGRTALLPGYRLLFNKESMDGSGKANLERHEGSETWGVLYVLSDADLQTLDDGEVGYRRMKLPICLTDNTTVDAWVYVAEKPSNEPTLRPYTWYMRFLIEGAREYALPADYISALERIEAQNDTDERRDRKRRALTCRAES